MSNKVDAAGRVMRANSMPTADAAAAGRKLSRGGGI